MLIQSLPYKFITKKFAERAYKTVPIKRIMGKQGKRVKNRSNELKTTDTISILTPTVKKREKCMFILAKCINKQTYISKISQWVIVSGDKEWNAIDFNNMIANLRNIVPKHVVLTGLYLDSESALKMGTQFVTTDYEAIGYLRNVSNMISTSDFLVCMDDDDYYPPIRVEHAVVSLKKSNKLVAGCSNHIMYDTDLNTVFQFKRFHMNHSINNVLAYKREYIVSGNKYVSTKKHAEEVDFLRNYSSSMIQLEPTKSVIQMCHANNTYNKRQLIVGNAWANDEQKKLFKISSVPTRYVPQNILNEYKDALGYRTDETSEYDIVYYTGIGAPNWSPYDTNLGGSEQAVKHLAESWTKLGFKVAVYGNFGPDITKLSIENNSGGIYLDYKDFRCSLKYKTLILWRYYGIHPSICWNLRADKIILDIHDSIPLHKSCIENMDKVSSIVVRSQSHLNKMCEIHKNNSEFKDKFEIIPNGVRVSEFIPSSSVRRAPYRFCWCSCYKRGLENILFWVWPIIKRCEPSAEFHVYYGMNSVKEQDFKDQMTKLLCQPGVVDHGRCSVDSVIKEKHTSTFHLYYSKTNCETDCISLRESACAGCIPIISKYSVFKERSGIHLDGDPYNQNDMQKIGLEIVKLMKDHQNIERIRNSLIGKETSWDDIAKLWKL